MATEARAGGAPGAGVRGAAPPAAVGITGASGFIGCHLVRHLAARGYTVRAFVRAPGARAAAEASTGPAPGSVSERRFVLPDGFDEHDLEGLAAIVHGALVEYGPGQRDADRVNREGCERLIAAARRRGTRVIFLSTLSAHEGARSHYGRIKLALESRFDPSSDCVLRLGLVLGEGGLFGSIVGLIRGARVIPLPDGGRQPIQTLWMGDLVRAIENVIARGLSGRFDVAAPEVHRMHDLYRAIMAGTGVSPRLVSVPLGLVELGAMTLEALRIPFPIRRENVLGLRALRAFDTAASMRALGIERPVGLEESVQRLLGPG
jgi:nucleoside-diphosphate-sugar epimerase